MQNWYVLERDGVSRRIGVHLSFFLHRLLLCDPKLDDLFCVFRVIVGSDFI